MASTHTEIMDATEAAAFLKVGEREADEDIAVGRLYRAKPGEDPVNALHRLSKDVDD